MKTPWTRGQTVFVLSTLLWLACWVGWAFDALNVYWPEGPKVNYWWWINGPFLKEAKIIGDWWGPLDIPKGALLFIWLGASVCLPILGGVIVGFLLVSSALRVNEGAALWVPAGLQSIGVKKTSKFERFFDIETQITLGVGILVFLCAVIFRRQEWLAVSFIGATRVLLANNSVWEGAVKHHIQIQKNWSVWYASLICLAFVMGAVALWRYHGMEATAYFAAHLLFWWAASFMVVSFGLYWVAQVPVRMLYQNAKGWHIMLYSIWPQRFAHYAKFAHVQNALVHTQELLSARESKELVAMELKEDVARVHKEDEVLTKTVQGTQEANTPSPRERSLRL